MSKAKDWGQQRRRDDPKHPGNKPNAPRGRKDRKKWCRGKEGVKHVPVLGFRSWTVSYKSHRKTICGPPIWIGHQDEWWCRHIEKCDECGKILRHLRDDECPDRPGVAS